MEKSRLRRTVESFNKNRESIVRTWIRNHRAPIVYWRLEPEFADIKQIGDNEHEIQLDNLEVSCEFRTKQDNLGRRYIEVTIEGYPVWADPMHFSSDWPKEL